MTKIKVISKKDAIQKIKNGYVLVETFPIGRRSDFFVKNGSDWEPLSHKTGNRIMGSELKSQLRFDEEEFHKNGCECYRYVVK